MATAGWSATARSPPPPPSENVMDTLFSYDNTIMLAAIISLLLVILFVLLLHLYARWFLSGHRHRLRPDHRPGPHQASSAVTTTYHVSPPRSKEAGATGLDSAAIHSIPTFSYEAVADAELECAVCLGKFEAGEVGRRLPRCSHCFHVECIDTWLVAHTTCPVCRLHVVVVQGGNGGRGRKEDGDRKDDDHNHNHNHNHDDVVLDILDDHDDVASDEGSSSSSSSPENAAFERFMRVAASRSCRSDVVSVANHHPSERPRPSI